MAKLSSINKNNRRIKLSDKLFNKRAKLKKIIMDKKIQVKISISEGYDETMIVTTTLKNFEEWVDSWGLDIKRFQCDDEGVDFQNTGYSGSYIDLVVDLKCKEKFVSISKHEFSFEE